MKFNVPCDPLKSIFTEGVILRLQKCLSKTPIQTDEYQRLLTRLNILTAGGEIPRSISTWEAHEFKVWRAFKAAWDTYIHTAYLCGLFEGNLGNDLKERLRSTDNNNFQGAIAECLACWLFSGKLGLDVQARPPGNKISKLEFLLQLPNDQLYVEVKSPYREPPSQSWSGDDSDKIGACLKEANDQFKKGNKNLLVIVPSLRLPIHCARGSLIKALYGEEAIVMDFDPIRGQGVGEARLEFQSNGDFMKRWGKDQPPRYTRTSLVISVEEAYMATHQVVDHKILVLHNPHAHNPCRDINFGNFPEFKQEGDYLCWSDGCRLFP